MTIWEAVLSTVVAFGHGRCSPGYSFHTSAFDGRYLKSLDGLTSVEMEVALPLGSIYLVGVGALSAGVGNSLSSRADGGVGPTHRRLDHGNPAHRTAMPRT